MDFDGQDSGDEPFITAVDNIQPYQFEPVVHIEQNEVSSQNQSDSEENSEVDESDSSDLQDSRMDNLAWCDCNNCTVMPTVDECLCCKEVGPVAEKMEDGDLDCITDHEGFTGNCLNRHVIEVSLYDFVERQGPVDDNEPIHDAEKRTSQSKLSKREQAIDCQLHIGESIDQSNSSFTEDIQFEVKIFCTKKKKAKAKEKMKNTIIETDAGQIKLTKARVQDNGLGKGKVAIKNQGENEVLKVHTSTGIGDDRGTCISLDTPVISNEKGENRFQKYTGNGKNRRDQQQYLENSNQEIKDTWEEWDYDEESSMDTELEQFKMDETRARSNCLCNSLTNQLLSVHGEAKTLIAYNVDRIETGTSDVENQLSFIDDGIKSY